MGLRVLHVIESKAPTAGSVAVCLPGLIEAQTRLEIEGQLAEPPLSAANVAGNSLVHIHGWSFSAAYEAARLARQAGIPYIISPLGQWPLGRNSRIGLLGRIRSHFSIRPLIRAAAMLAAVNDAEKQILQSAGAHENVVVLPYGLSFATEERVLSAAKPKESISKELLVLGPLDPAMGCVAALKAFAEVGPASDQWKMTVAGHDTSNWRPKLEAAVQRKGGAGRVEFCEAATPQEQRQLLDRAALLIAPGLQITPAVSIMLAFDRSVPIIATNLSAPPGVGDELRVCEAGRAGLSRTMREVMEMPDEQRNALATSARSLARTRFDWSVLAPQYAEQYRRCLKS